MGAGFSIGKKKEEEEEEEEEELLDDDEDDVKRLKQKSNDVDESEEGTNELVCCNCSECCSSCKCCACSACCEGCCATCDKKLRAAEKWLGVSRSVVVAFVVMVIFAIVSIFLANRYNVFLEEYEAHFNDTEATDEIGIHVDKLFDEMLLRENAFMAIAHRVDDLLDDIALRQMKGTCFVSKVRTNSSQTDTATNKASLVREHIWLKFSEPVESLCEGTTEGGGWLLFQRHRPLEDEGAFEAADWDAYRDGFGDPGQDSGAYWLGLNLLHRLTRQGMWDLLIKLKWSDGSLRGRWGFVKYSGFQIEGENENFKIRFDKSTRKSSGLPGAGGTPAFVPTEPMDLVVEFNGKPFTTRDSDHDESVVNCAIAGRGGWWFDACSDICLNCRELGWVYMEYTEDGKDKQEHLPQETQMAMRPSP